MYLKKALGDLALAASLITSHRKEAKLKSASTGMKSEYQDRSLQRHIVAFHLALKQIHLQIKFNDEIVSRMQCPR